MGGGSDLSSESASGSDGMIQARLLDGIGRSVTVVLGAQISSFLGRYFSLTEVLLILVVVHSLMSMSYISFGGFRASWLVMKGLVQSILIQLSVSYLTSFGSPVASLLNLLAFLLVAECIPAASGWSKASGVEWIGEDRALFFTSVSYIFSDEVTVLLTSLHVPLVCASVGLLCGERTLLAQTLILTGINALCQVVFSSVGGVEVSIAWPVILLYFVHEVVGQFEAVQPFMDHGMYKASDAMYAGLVGLGVGPDVIALMFLFLGFTAYMLDMFSSWGLTRRGAFALSSDELWIGLCALVMVRAASDWFLGCVSLVINSDSVLGGLCVVAAVHFVTLGVESTFGRAAAE